MHDAPNAQHDDEVSCSSPELALLQESAVSAQESTWQKSSENIPKNRKFVAGDKFDPRGRSASSCSRARMGSRDLKRRPRCPALAVRYMRLTTGRRVVPGPNVRVRGGWPSSAAASGARPAASTLKRGGGGDGYALTRVPTPTLSGLSARASAYALNFWRWLRRFLCTFSQRRWPYMVVVVFKKLRCAAEASAGSSS